MVNAVLKFKDGEDSSIPPLGTQVHIEVVSNGYLLTFSNDDGETRSIHLTTDALLNELRLLLEA